MWLFLLGWCVMLRGCESIVIKWSLVVMFVERVVKEVFDGNFDLILVVSKCNNVGGIG